MTNNLEKIVDEENIISSVVKKLVYTGFTILAAGKCGGYIPFYDSKNNSYKSQ